MLPKKAVLHHAATHRALWMAVTWLLVVLNALQFMTAYQIQLRGMAHTHGTAPHGGHKSEAHFHSSLSHHRHAYAFDSSAVSLYTGAQASAQWQDTWAHRHAEATDSESGSAALWAGLYVFPAPDVASGLIMAKTHPQPPPKIFYASFHPAVPDKPPQACLCEV